MGDEQLADIDAPLTCPECQAVLAKSLFRIAKVAFPDQVGGINLIAVGGADYILCPVCGEMVKWPSLTICRIKPLARWLLLIPSELEKRIPVLLVTRIRRQWQKEGNDIADLETFSDSLRFRQKVCHYIAKIVAPLHNGYLHAAATEQLPRWAWKHKESLDYSCFAALWLLAQPGWPINFHIKEVETDAPVPSAEEYALSGVTAVPGVKQTPHEEAREMILENLSGMLNLRLMQFAEEIGREHTLDQLPSSLQAIMPSEAVTDGVIIGWNETLVALCEDEQTMGLYYPSQAILAALCLIGKKENPMAADWTKFVVHCEHASRVDADFPTGMRVSSEFAAQTISPHSLLDYYTHLMNALLAKRFTPEQGAEALAVVTTIEKLEQRLGLDEWWLENITGRLNAQFHALSDEKLEHFIAKFCNEPESLHILFPAIECALVKRDKELALGWGRRVWQEVLRAGLVKEAVWTVVRLSEQWNERGVSATAMQEVRVCKRALQEAGAWPLADVYSHSALLTEEGNCLRYHGDLREALRCYENIRAVLPEDDTSPNVRRNERNRAIVLRDLGQVGESLNILHRLAKHARPAEQPALLHSIAVCHVIAGRYPEAKHCLLAALMHVEQEKLAGKPLELNILLSMAPIELRLGDNRCSIQFARRALEVAREIADPVRIAKAAGFLATALLKDPEEDQDSQVVAEEALALIRAVLEQTQDFVVNSASILILNHQAAVILGRIGKLEAAEQILEQNVVLHHFDYDVQAWLFWMTLAKLAIALGKPEAARQRLMKAYRAVVQMAERIAPTDDLVSMMQDKDELQFLLCEHFLQTVQTGETQASDLRLVADFQASLLLSRQLAWMGRPMQGFPSLPENQEFPSIPEAEKLVPELRSLAESCPGTAAVLQFFRTQSELHLLISYLPPSQRDPTTLTVSGEPHTELAHWHVPYAETISLSNEAWHRLERASPARKDDPLDSFSDWQAFAAGLRLAVETLVPLGTHLCLISGALTGMPLQYVFGDAYPLSYVPSLSAAAALRRRRLALDDCLGQAWRPRNLHDFVVWKVGETAGNVGEFARWATALREDVEARGGVYRASTGLEATRQALFDALRQSDCVRLSCHGRGDPRNLRFDLLVADGGRLPPGHPTVLANELGKRFLVGWEELATLASAAPLVFSTACTSGLTTSLRGGERVGLERSLLRAGTVAFAAPQWPVKIAVIQPLVNRIIKTYFDAPKQTLAEVIFRETNQAIQEGVKLQVARSLAVHGDWL
jgi:tetratricopeptide (TPR) repeat protein